MNFLNTNLRYQPPLNEVLDQVDSLQTRVERLEERTIEIENENSRLYRILSSLDERINILIDEKN